MKKRLSGIEQKILAVLQQGLGESRSPYRDMARRIGIETRELLSVLQDWKQQGKLRRIGAIVNHFKLGLGAGAMVVWPVEPGRTEQAGRKLAAFEQVSHAYERRASRDWPYSLYTMVHAKTAEEVREIVEQMSEACGLTDYRILHTQRELKKVPPTYIIDEEQG
ncbi:MAG: Lrp/AsnC family transcriptional regulator [Phycisphaerae bacterium]|nr:Lrp/AsnC family transcriptional regulator [Phycisphaerae bacterium]